tara:strand:- start:2920 stop:3198 length:279 start_codon:yes stop_codon:yes gene_type:complete
MKKSTVILLLFFTILTACSNLFNGAVLPNQCKKCDVVNLNTNKILFSNEGCGSQNTRLEEEAKVKAYDLSKSNNLCDLEVRCINWKKAPDPK